MSEFRYTEIRHITVTADDEFRGRKVATRLLEHSAATMLDYGAVRVGEPTILDPDAQGNETELMDILAGTYLGDEVESANGVCRPGLVPVDGTDVPERLIAWRDAAVRRALEAGAR
jgi:GNAT superfamily N-acetyltransferase